MMDALELLGLSVLVLHLFVANAQTNFYYQRDVDALQIIWGNWNKSTPDLSDNLPGWTSQDSTNISGSSIYPCQSLSNDASATQTCSLWAGRVSTKYPCQNLSNPAAATIPNWRGVFCFKTNDILINNSAILVNGLSISNASIVGTLPPEIGNLLTLTTLELTGNPGLTGPLPDALGGMYLNILDVHDNNFTGNIPESFILSSYLQQFDLSGNQFEGGYPFNQTSTMAYLQVLSIGGNRLTGNLRPDTFVNKTELETLALGLGNLWELSSSIGEFTSSTIMGSARDISNNGFTGALPDLNPLKTKLKYLDVSGNQFEGQLPNLTQFSLLSTANFGGNAFFLAGNDAPLLDILWNGVAQNSALTTLNLSYNQLTGPLSSWNFSPSLGSVQSLLYLDNNKLSGTLDISKMLAWGLLEERLSFGSTQNVTGRRLNTMSLRNNNISHVVSDPYAIANTTTLFILQGNPYCDNYNSKDDAQRCYCTQYCYATPASLQEDRRKITIIAAVISVLAVVFILLLVVGAILYKNRRYKLYLQLEVQKKFEEFDVKPTIFSYNELRTATQDFHEDMKLGQGSYGAVYKGVLPNGNAVAVKQLYARATQGMDEFLNEVILITGMKHRNLVNLKGCCVRDNQRLLVYEYVDNFDVNQILLERGSRRKVVNWPTRLKICLGIAQGLHYLHALAHPRVIHRDIKASNVLLDKNLTPKIADFGLVLLFPDEETHIMTVHVAGTKGYLAPEYASYGQLSDKVDVFSFGVLCLEIISGRRNIDETKPQDQVYLAQWAWQLHEEGRLIELVDSTLQLTDEETVRDVQRVINMCLMCIQTGAEKRPTMATIVSILQSSDGAQVLAPAAKDDKRPHFESIFESTLLRSQESVNFMSTSVMEEDGSSSHEYRAKSLSPGFSQRRRGGVVEMKEITTVGREGSSDPMLL